MSLVSLQSALTGLSVTQRQLEVTARNLASASTPGYTKKTLGQKTIFAGSQAMGVSTGVLQRSIDTKLQRDFWSQLSTNGYHQTSLNYLKQVQQLHGNPDSENSIAADISRLADSFRKLQPDPTSPARQTEIVNYARTLANHFNRTSASIQQMRNDVQDQMKDSVDTINQKLAIIVNMNKDITAASSGGQSTADLEDQRDNALRDLSELVDVNYYTGSDGTMTVITKSGHVLADRSARTLSFDPTTQSYSTYYPATSAAISIGATDITSKDLGGKLGKLIDLRDNVLPQQQARLDELAHKIAMRFDSQNLRLFVGADGTTVPTNTVANYVGFSAVMQVNPSILSNTNLIQTGTTGTPSSVDSVVRNVIDRTFGLYSDSSNTAHTAFGSTGLGPGANLATELLGTATIEDFAKSIITSQAVAYDNEVSTADYELNYKDTLEKSMLDSSGVSIDEEMAKMIELQKAYGASAKMVTAINQMFDDLLRAF